MNQRPGLALIALAVVGCVAPAEEPRGADGKPGAGQQQRLEVADPSGTYPPLELQGNWRFDGGRYCVSNEDAAIITPAGPLWMLDAEVCVTTSPFGIEGEAGLPFPTLGFLSDLGASVAAPRAHLALALGHELGAIPIGDLSMQPNPNHYYLIVDYLQGYQVALGAVTLNTPGGEGHMVIDPLEPLVYVAGRASGLLPQEIEGAFGFSAAGRLPYRSHHEVYDGRTVATRELDGHLLLQATLPVGPYPISVAGTFFADVDADGDGRTVFAGDARDLVLAGDAALSLGYDVAGFGMSVEVGSASFVYDARQGSAGGFFFGGSASNRIFDGTPLQAFQPTSATVQALGAFRSLDDFDILLNSDLSVLGFTLAGAQLTLDPQGVTVDGLLRLPGLGQVDVGGSVGADGRFELDGSGTLAPGGLRMANARVHITPSGVALSGGVSFAGTGFQVSGKIAAGGSFSLAGSIDVNLAVVQGSARLVVSDRGASATLTGRACLSSVCIDLVSISIDSNGQICPTFPLIGRKCITVL